jgi:hypothetical protein
MNISALSERTMSAFMLSIGTSLSFESLFPGTQPPYDPSRLIPNKININEYDELWINIFTLFRNIVSAVPSIKVSTLTPEDVGYVLGEEVDLIREIVKMYTNDNVKVIFYSSSYSNLKNEFKHASVRIDNTEKQRQMTDLLTGSINVFYKIQTRSDSLKHFKLFLEGNVQSKNKKILLFSNYAFDLLSQPQFSKMDLLESHTGVLKDKAKWYTKYIDGKNLVRMPFNRLLLQVFGDSQTFYPMDKNLRKDIIELSDSAKWNPLTTDERVRFTITQIKNPYFVSILKDML